MCGIFCAVRHSLEQETLKEVLQGLHKLEYRGYDSCGMGWDRNPRFDLSIDTAYSLEELKEKIFIIEDPTSNIVIGHNRWSSSSAPTLDNAHPIIGGKGEVLLVHNGTIDNYEELKENLKENGYRFYTETDTEVIAHLADAASKNYEWRYVPSTINIDLWGTWAYAFITTYQPNKLFCSCNGSPLYFTANGYVSSDVQSLKGLSETYEIMEDGDTLIIEYGEHLAILWCDANGRVKLRKCNKFDEDVLTLSKTESHHMREEILRQFDYTILCNLPEPKFHTNVFFGCGSSYNAALYASKIINDTCSSRNVSCHYATEFPKIHNRFASDVEYIAISQSGESIDVIDVMKGYLDKKNITLITNTPDSTATRFADRIIPLKTEPEIGVAATITFTLTVLALLKYFIPNYGWKDHRKCFKTIFEETDEKIKKLSYEFVKNYPNIMFLGTNYDYPIAREAALKMKECCYIHAESTPAAEFKHGPLSIVNPETLSVFLISNEFKLERTIANMAQIRARQGKILTICNERLAKKVYNKDDEVILVHDFRDNLLQPLGLNFVCQLMAYYTGLAKGINPDKPRHIAKAISVR